MIDEKEQALMDLEAIREGNFEKIKLPLRTIRCLCPKEYKTELLREWRNLHKELGKIVENII